MGYLEADVRDAGAMLAHAERFFGAERPVAVGCIGVGYFLTDDQLRGRSNSAIVAAGPRRAADHSVAVRCALR